MKFSNVLGFLAIGAVAAAPAEDRSALDLTHVEAKTNNLEARANLPGLNALQSKYARAIIAKAKADGVGAHGCQAGIATALVEVSFVSFFFSSLRSMPQFDNHFTLYPRFARCHNWVTTSLCILASLEV